MAKKKEVKGEVDDLDFDDLGDLGEDFQFEEDGFDDPERSPSKSEVAVELAKDAGEGFLDSLASKTAEKALPPEYSANYSDVMDMASFAGEVVDKNKQQIDKSLFKLGKEVKKLLPFQIGILDRYLEKKEEEFAEFKSQSEEEMRNASMASELTSIFDKQLEIQKAVEAKRSAEEQVSAKERLVSTSMNLDLLRSIDASAALSAAFDTQIAKEYYRKSLELQFKSFYVQADMLRTMRDYYKGFSIQFTNIEKNTGLPEFVKLKKTEALQELVRNNAVSSLYGSMFSNSKYMETIKKRISRAVSDKVTGVTEQMNEITDMLSMMNESGSGMGALASAGASMGGGALGEMASKYISPKIQERIKDNKYINAGAKYLQAFSNSPSTFFRTMRDMAARKETENEGTWSAKLFGMARAGLDLTSKERPDTAVNQDTYLDHNQPAIFDRRVHRSITEAIPMYLAKILKQNTDLTSMYYGVNQKKIGARSEQPELSYDYKERRLDTIGNIRKNIEDSVFASKSKRVRTKPIAANVIGQSKNAVAKNESLSKEDKKKITKVLEAKGAKDKLADYYDKASNIQGLRMDHETLILKAEENEQLKEMVERDQQLKQLIDTIKAHSEKDNTYIDRSLKDMQNPYPIEAVKELFKQASVITNAKQPNIISDEDAKVIAKGFSRFKLNQSSDVTTEAIITGSAIQLLDEEWTKEITTAFAILRDDCRIIRDHGDWVNTGKLTVLIAAVNNALESGVDSTGVYNTLRELDPSLVRGKKYTVEQLVEGKLIAGPTEDFTSASKVREMTKATSREMLGMRENAFTHQGANAMLEKFKNRSDAFKKGVKDNSHSPVALASFLIGEAKSFKSTVAGALDKVGGELKKGFEEVGKRTDELIKNGTKEAVVMLLQEFKALDAKLINYIDLTQKDIQQRTEELEKAKAAVVDITTQTKLQAQAQRELELFIRASERNIKALTRLQQTVRSQTVNLESMSQREGISVKELLTNFSKSLKEIVADIHAKIAELEAVGAKEAATAQAA